jgi:hypothetical protein
VRPPLLPLVIVTIAWAGAACGSGVSKPAVPSAAAPEWNAASGEPPPVPGPIVTVTGCVESRELRAYVLALDARRGEDRAHALTAAGARAEQRRGSWAEPGLAAPLDQTVTRGERRFAVVAELAAGVEPVVSLARSGRELRRIDERARAHPVRVLSCSERRCPNTPAAPPSAPARPEVRPLLVELAPGESLGAPLSIAYDYWWADVEYASRERCPAGP